MKPSGCGNLGALFCCIRTDCKVVINTAIGINYIPLVPNKYMEGRDYIR